MLFTLLACFVGVGIVARAQEERPVFIPGERKVPRKKEAGPRALAILQMTASGKVTLVPVAILINGKFWDASAYKANPVPMALEAGTVYEGERTGSSVGLFTIGSALHSLAVNAQVPWIGTGTWLAEGKDAPNKPMKAEGVPVGIDNSDAPPRLSKGGSSSGNKPASDKTSGDKSAGDKSGASDAPSSTSNPPGASSPSSSSSGSGASGDEPPRLSRPAQSSGSGDAGSSQPTSGSSTTTPSAPSSPAPTSSAPTSAPSDSKPSSDKSSDDRPTLKRPDQTSDQSSGQNPQQDKSKQGAADKSASSAPPPPESDSGAGAGYRPRLRRGKPTTSFADEVVPGYGKPGTTTSASAKASAAASTPAQEIIDLVPAISDAGSNELHAYNFIWLKDEEGERRKQIEGIAKQEVAAYLAAQAKAMTAPVTAGTKAGAKTGAKPAAHATAKKAPEPVLENVKMVAYDLWGNNTPVIVFSADAHLPASPAGAAQSGVADLQYSVMLVLRPDIYDTLRKLYVGVTDKFHLDITPRLQLVDAVDADGDGRGELLFKEVSDAGPGWILYRASADKLWKMFDSLSPE